MPVIRSDRPATSTLPTTKAEATERTSATNKTEQKRDVFVKDGALSFDEGTKADAQTQLQRAKRFLEVLRTDNDGKLSFGGRVAVGGVDRSATLRSYYPSLKAAKELAADEDLAEGVQHFAEKELGVPDDLRELALKASGGKVAPKVEKAEPLGSAQFSGNNAEWQPIYQSMNQTGAAVDVNRMKLDDASVQRLLQGFFGNQFNVQYFQRATPEAFAMKIRIYARQKEIGGAAANVNAQNINATLQRFGANVTPDMISAVRRLAHAYGIDPATIVAAGKPLSEATPSKPAPPAIRSSVGGGAAAAPLGAVVWTNNNQWSNIHSHASSNPAIAIDVNQMKLDDAGCRNCVQQFYSNNFYQSWFARGNADVVAGLLNVFSRSKETGGGPNVQVPVHVQHLNNILARFGVTPPKEIVDAVRRAATAFGFDPKSLTINGAPLPPAVARAAHVPAHRKTVLGGTPMSNSALDQNGFNNYWNARDTRLFSECNDGILQRQYINSGYNPDTWHNQVQHPGAVTLCARLVELGSVNTKAQSAQWLRNGVPQQYSGDAYIPELARLAHACDVDPATVIVHKPDGTNAVLANDPHFPKPVEDTVVKTAIADAVAKLDPAAKTDNAAKVAALQALTSTDAGTGVEFDEAVEAAKAALKDGKFAPIEFDKLDEAQKGAVIDAITADAHPGVASVLAGLFLDGGDAQLVEKLKALGVDEVEAKLAGDVAGRFRDLDANAKASVLDNLDFLSWPLRVSLAARVRLSPDQLSKIFDENVDTDPVGTARALVDRAILEGSGTKIASNVGDLLRAKLAEGKINESEVKAALDEGRYAVVLSDVESDVDDAVKRVVSGVDAGALDALKTTLKDNAKLVDVDTLVESALGKIYQSDLARVVPLDQADKELGGVSAKPWVDEDKLVDDGIKKVTVAGIDIQANDDPARDMRAVPRADAAGLVMTDTTEKNLKLIAAEWRRGRPVLLEGPTSAGKTSAVRYIAHVTGSPYRRINLSYHTDVSDLIGRYVGGELKYTKADLAKKTDEEIAELAEDYGLDEGLSAADQRAQILDAQEKPRWVDGPIVKAMRRGEVLLLDEVNLARPEVIERLNSLFDDDGNLVLTEHRNEVVERHKNFRIFATMNPASYAGRARLSEAMRSRWTSLYTQGLTQADLTKILKAKYNERVPDQELAKLIAAHDALARAADDGTIGRASGGTAYSLRNLFRVCDRFERYRGGALGDEALMRRETEEIYRGGLFDDEDITAVNDILTTAMPYNGPGFYENLEIKEDKDTFTIGDVSIRKLNTGHTFVPKDSSRLVMTARTKQILYRLAKALDSGENVALIGERASGKTAIAKMYANMIGQPYFRQLISASTDVMQLVGGYDDRGWKDGLLLDAGRPDGVPGMLLLDELNLGSSALLERLNPVLDDERKIVLAEKEGEEVKLHPDFHFVGAMNPPTKGYGGRQKLSKAMQNRLTTIYVPDLGEKAEQMEIVKAIAAKKKVPEAVAECLVELHQWAVAAYDAGTQLGKNYRELDKPVLSIRQLLSALDMIADFMKDRDAGDAYMLAIEAYYASNPDLEDNKLILAKAKEIAS